jgi:hypothetical protein
MYEKMYILYTTTQLQCIVYGKTALSPAAFIFQICGAEDKQSDTKHVYGARTRRFQACRFQRPLLQR